MQGSGLWVALQTRGAGILQGVDTMVKLLGLPVLPSVSVKCSPGVSPRVPVPNHCPAMPLCQQRLVCARCTMMGKETFLVCRSETFSSHV